MRIESYIKKSLRLILESKSFENQEMVDAILDKVASQGMESLTPQERNILQNPNDVPEPYDKNKTDRELIDSVFPPDEDENPYAEEQEDQVLKALDHLIYHHGAQLRRKRAKDRDEDFNEYYYIKFIDNNGNHIFNLEERVMIKHGGGEEEVSILHVDSNLWANLFIEFSVDDDDKIKVFQKYLGEMFGYDIMEVEPVQINH